MFVAGVLFCTKCKDYSVLPVETSFESSTSSVSSASSASSSYDSRTNASSSHIPSPQEISEVQDNMARRRVVSSPNLNSPSVAGRIRSLFSVYTPDSAEKVKI